MPIHPMLDPTLSEEQSLRATLGNDYDPSYTYRLAAARNLGTYTANGWEITKHVIGDTTLIRRRKTSAHN